MKKILTIILVAFIMMQFFPIDKTNPPINKGMDFINIKKTPAETAKMIKTTCYDCHSNETRYPWYANIAPASWFLKNHIDEGRKELNFSTFSSYPAKVQAHKLQECIEVVTNKEMPLESYIVGHQEAKLTDEQRNRLAAYFRKMKDDTERKIMLLK
ncbi:MULTISPECIES: heme-binding domain-containing protein [Chryseobacterium]|uniref:Cytochrome c553 n=1 Tax=Chryseobacterium camelliae TaxID=1265445 RepID=A0ABU0TKT3_9FLAO|nr:MULTISPECIES: heme-binding domain-containing protein [Chryseobacterium]MDT3408750.1 cytochrome c553 [Pseudacidovorax intermedius]MDQ1097396.1 cytochrome c553 [Chryseobacterium camelliae]MDQ1101326.1 cytochrome c553 [Chryseobacterium sp. SORGH_AS_1048]MDR6084771.1 cytochrome c553 [Chryseobacterium sp. SORGH_AS_0909]MDR6129118.1 cytochrome c553 [Chryseobacterium sp. SORGH_AS_1175]